MTDDKPKRRWWRFKLWHLFALTLGVALGLWLAQHVSLYCSYYMEEIGPSYYIEVQWDDERIFRMHDSSWVEPEVTG